MINCHYFDMRKIKCINTGAVVGTISTAKAGVVPVVQRDRGRPWMRKRQSVLERDGYLCQVCAKRGLVELAREVDHITPLHRGGTDHPDNLQSLCRDCHAAKSADEDRERRGCVG